MQGLEIGTGWNDTLLGKDYPGTERLVGGVKLRNVTMPCKKSGEVSKTRGLEGKVVGWAGAGTTISVP